MKKFSLENPTISYIILGFVFAAVLWIGFFAQPARSEVTVQQTIETIQTTPTLTEEDRRQIECMAVNSYFEARAEPRDGIIAVHNVVLNRVQDSRFPDTPCGVVYQRNRRGCQFSWYCDGHSDNPRNRELYSELEELAEEVYTGEHNDVTNGAKFYHATYVRPRWRHAMEKTTQIGAHIFYKG